MAFSYSFHISAKSHSVSTIGKVNQVGRHNLREYKNDLYDKSKIDVMVGQGTMLDMIKECYHREFDEALEKYNQGKRADRQVNDYLEHVGKSRADVAVEIIIQIGDKDFWEDKDDSDKRKMRDVFKDQLRTLQKAVPDFKIVSAVAHYDEASPHIHVVGVPVACGYKKGMEKQCAKTRVFTEETLAYLQNVMRENAEKNITSMPLFEGMELKEKEKGRNKDIPKESLDKFYKLQEAVEKTEDALIDADVALRNTLYQHDIALERTKNISDTASDLQEEINTLKDLKTQICGNLENMRNEYERTERAVLDLKKQLTEIKGVELQMLKAFVSLPNVVGAWEQFKKSVRNKLNANKKMIEESREDIRERSAMSMEDWEKAIVERKGEKEKKFEENGEQKKSKYTNRPTDKGER